MEEGYEKLEEGLGKEKILCNYYKNVSIRSMAPTAHAEYLKVVFASVSIDLRIGSDAEMAEKCQLAPGIRMVGNNRLWERGES